MDWSGNVLHCSERVNGYSGSNLYLTIIGSDENCTSSGLDLPIELSIGSIVNSDADGMDTLSAGFYTFIELTPAEMAVGEITITATQPDGLGNICMTSRTIDLTALEVSCNITCLAGGINADLLNNGIIACENGTINLSTDGLEDLNLPCASDNGSGYQYGWRILIDIYNTGDFEAITEWELVGPNTTIDVNSFFVDDFGYLPPYFTPGTPIPMELPYYYVPTALRIQGAALCIDSDGTIVEACAAVTQGYESSLIEVTYLPKDDSACDCLVGYIDCAGICDGNTEIDCEGVCGGNILPGSVCVDDNGNAGVYNDVCMCIPDPILGCTDAIACNYNEEADTNDDSCTYPLTENFDCEGNCLLEEDCAGTCGGPAIIDCEGTCGGSSIEGETCMDANGNEGMYDNTCDCVLNPIPGCTDTDACNYNPSATAPIMRLVTICPMRVWMMARACLYLFATPILVKGI